MSHPNQFSVIDHYGGDQLRTSEDPLTLRPWCPQYYLHILSCLKTHLAPCGLHFIVTWNISRLPFTGTHVVVMLIGDERSQIPAYATKVLATFRNGTQTLQWPHRPSQIGYLLWLLKFVRVLRDIAIRIRRSLKFRCPLRPPNNVFTIPLGAMTPCGVEPEPLTARKVDISLFASVGQFWSVGPLRIPYRPKTLLRNAAFEALHQTNQKNPQLNIETGCQDNPCWGPPLPLKDYPQMLRDTKICPCPSGNFTETFRHYEAVQAGCIVISEPPPNEWYFNNHPFITIERWEHLPMTIASLLSDPHAMQRHSDASLRWWNEQVCPEAVAKTMFTALLQCKPDICASPSHITFTGPQVAGP